MRYAELAFATRERKLAALVHAELALATRERKLCKSLGCEEWCDPRCCAITS